MSNRVGNRAQEAIESAQPYRRHLIGLPLQRSLFGLTASAASTLGFPGLSSEFDFPARLDEKGDLFLDRSRIAALTQGLLSQINPETLELMRTTHAAACEALVAASENAARITPLEAGATRKMAEDLANKMVVVLVFGVLSKFVPDVLLGALTDAGGLEPLPFPEKSAGAELMRNMFTLSEACRELGYSPARMLREWPDLSPEVFQLVCQFCQRQKGFGPLAWDSPGYEDPNYVIRFLHSAFAEVDAEQVRQRLSFAERPALAKSATGGSAKVDALRRVLGFWLDFLERETWYARRAFYVGMRPLLHQLATEHRREIPAFQPADLLFLEIREMVEGRADPAVIEARRQSYLGNIDYLSLQGIDSSRLANMLGSS